MSTARTTPAQNPRGRTLSNTFPFVPVCIVILIRYFRTLYHTSGPAAPAPGFHPASGSGYGKPVYPAFGEPIPGLESESDAEHGRCSDRLLGGIIEVTNFLGFDGRAIA